MEQVYIPVVREYEVVIPYQVRSYQTHVMKLFMTLQVLLRRNPLSSQVISNLRAEAAEARLREAQVVIPYQVRSYQTENLPPAERRPCVVCRNPLSSQVISNVCTPNQ